jgi:hypothetical protein
MSDLTFVELVSQYDKSLVWLEGEIRPRRFQRKLGLKLAYCCVAYSRANISVCPILARCQLLAQGAMNFVSEANQGTGAFSTTSRPMRS